MPSANQTHSPSPPPGAPTASTPGIRAGGFIDLYDKTLTKTLKSINYDSFAACFPLIAKQAPDSLRSMHGAFVRRLESFAKDEFQRILEERSVVENLNKIDDLITNAQRRRARATTDETPIPPHTLPAPTVLSAHLAPLQATQQSQLNARIQTISSQNAELVKSVTEQRTEIESLVALLEALFEDLGEAGGLLEAEGGQLAREAREAEEAMAHA